MIFFIVIIKVINCILSTFKMNILFIFYSFIIEIIVFIFFRKKYLILFTF